MGKRRSLRTHTTYQTNDHEAAVRTGQIKNYWFECISKNKLSKKNRIEKKKNRRLTKEPPPGGICTLVGQTITSN